MAQQPQDFESAKSRLEEIVNAVSDESLPLDDALDLFEEAVALGLKVSDFVEDGIVVDDEAILAEGLQADAATSAGADAADATATADAPGAADAANTADEAGAAATGATDTAAPQQAGSTPSDSPGAASAVAAD